MSTDLYDENFYRKRTTYQKRAPLMCNGIIQLYHPISVIDCGCALGDLVAEFLHQGIKSEGIEGNSSVLSFVQCPKENINIFDLSKALPTLCKYDVVTCFEVLEHINSEYENIVVDNLCGLSNILVMSICYYGPTTKVHPNIKPKEHWINAFEQRGYKQQQDKEIKLLGLWEPIRKYPAVSECFKGILIMEKE